MLRDKRLTIVSDCYIDDEKIATFGAVLNGETMELTMTNRYINKEFCKIHKDVVRADQAAFEDYAYEIQDMLQGVSVPEADETSTEGE